MIVGYVWLVVKDKTYVARSSNCQITAVRREYRDFLGDYESNDAMNGARHSLGSHHLRLLAVEYSWSERGIPCDAHIQRKDARRAENDGPLLLHAVDATILVGTGLKGVLGAVYAARNLRSGWVCGHAHRRVFTTGQFQLVQEVELLVAFDMI